MAYEYKPGQGSAFKNEEKQADWHADFRGRVMLPDGKMHWLDVTNKVGKDGKPFVSIKIGKECQKQGAPVYSAAHQPFAPTNPKASPTGIPGLDEDIPF